MAIFHDRAALFDVVRDSWVDILDLEEDDSCEPLSGTSNFFQSGGDSSLARDLSGALREDHDISLTLADIFQHPTLDGLVDAIIALSSNSEIRQEQPKDHADIQPFSLLPNWPQGHEPLVQELASVCGLKLADVEDVYPCTALQEGLIAMSQQVEGTYWASHVFKLESEAHLSRLYKAWGEVIEAYPILRTLIAQTEAGSLFQVVSRTRPPFDVTDRNLQDLLQETNSITNTLNSPLSRFSVVRNSGDIGFVWRIHHSAFDLPSARLILDALELAWQDQPMPPSPPFNAFIAETLTHDSEEARNFWVKRLQGASSCVLPSTAPTSAKRDSFSTAVRHLSTQWQQRGSSFSLPTILHAAWALVLAQHAGVDDVVYGGILSSREAQWRAIAAPIISTIPVRLPINPTEPVADFLSRVQSYMAESLPYAHLGLQKIRQLGNDMEAACSFQSLMVTHPVPKRVLDSSVDSNLPARTYVKDSNFHAYDLTAEAFIRLTEVEIKMHHNESKLSTHEVQRLLRHFEQATSQLIRAIGDSSSQQVSEINICGLEDLEEIRAFNFQCPEAEQSCIYQLVSRAVRENPESTAIISHDAPNGLTFQELDVLSSELAKRIIDSGVQPGQMIPLLFEKSVWAVVAMLAVLKAGAAFVPLEWTQPIERLQQIVSQVNATTILASSQNESAAAQLQAQNPSVIVSDVTMSHKHTTLDSIVLPSASPGSLAYVVFTSGSTGVPKGVKISHQAFCTSATAHGPALGFTKSSRVLQFSSYSFDVSIAEIFTTLISGGCVCIPTDNERLHDLAGVIQRLEISLAVLTPAVFEYLPVEAKGTLSTVILTGDTSSQGLVDRWSSYVTLMNAYGPSESSVWAYTNHLGQFASSNTIGFPRGCVGWVVNPENAHQLSPLGCAGELLLQGPILSDGYLDDSDKTESSFVSHLAWQQNPEARLYKTGDLVRQHTDGSISFLGRTDTQIKIRGQRVEISEIENHIRRLLPVLSAVAVEPVSRDESDQSTMSLVAFCHFDSGARKDKFEIISEEDHTKEFLRLRAALSNVLPSYMVPQAYVPISRMPMGVSGKLDRKALRSILAGTTDDQWRGYLLVGEARQTPMSPNQIALRSHWAKCLNITEDSIGLQDSFFRLGGTSILAMRLSTLCRQRQITLHVSDVFKNPTLEAMTEVADFQATPNQKNGTEKDIMQPFSLLASPMTGNERPVDDVAPFAGLDATEIEDAYPATPLQEGLIAATQIESGAYIMHRVHRLQGPSMSRFLDAWTQLVHETAILRTRLVQTKLWGLLQVVSHSVNIEEIAAPLDQFVAEQRAKSLTLGEPLNHYSIVTNPDNEKFFVWQVHHAAFDGWSMRLVYERFLQIYYGMTSASPSMPFRSFVQHLQHLDMNAAAQFWRERLRGSKAFDFPKFKSIQTRKAENKSSTLKFSLDRQWRTRCDFTLSTILNAAWALVLATHNDNEDVVFGTTLSGRAAPLEGIEKVAGPTMATIPVRLTIDGAQSLQDFLNDTHGFLSDVVPFEQFGLANIRALGRDAEAACAFKTLILLQPSEDSDLTSLEGIAPKVELSTVNVRYQTYDIALEVFELGDTLELRMNYNTSCLEETEASWLLSHVKTAVTALVNEVMHESLAKVTVGQLSLFGSDDERQLREWQPSQVSPSERCIHDIVSEAVKHRPSKEAIRAWDGVMTYQELDELSSRLALHLVHETGVRPNEPVLLCFKKSKLAIIAMLATLKAGATMVPLEWSHPQARLEEIANGVQARHALTTEEHVADCASLGVGVEIISMDLITTFVPETEKSRMPQVAPNQVAYIIFTSGSTGTPKGIPVSHISFSTTIEKFRKAYLMSDSSRVFHFASYAFDVSLMETLIPLCYGATICIPPEQGRKDNLAAEFARLNANYALLGPGVVSTLDIDKMPGLQVLVLGGEAVPSQMLREWGRVADIVIAYGSTECAAVDHSLIIPRGTNPPSWTGGLLGRSIGSARSWIVSATDHNRLAPLGYTGQLVIEGPIVGNGYLNEEAKTQSHYVPVTEISWLSGFPGEGESRQSGFVYKTGDIVRYNVDGSLSYFGRKDLRVKIRGQRVEMGDIETCARHALPHIVSAAAELVNVRRLGTTDTTKMLAIFVCFPNSTDAIEEKEKLLLSAEGYEDDMRLLQETISSSLPSHMLPQLFIPVCHMPVAASGKVDRKKLQDSLSAIDDSMLFGYQLSQDPGAKGEMPANKVEDALRDLWADCLNIADKDAISRQSHFVRLGGNSISAMRLAALAREHDLTLTVVDILKYPVLSKMAEVAELEPAKEEAKVDVEPFSLVEASGDEKTSLISRISAKYGLDEKDIVDIYPCTPLQEGLVALTHAKPNEYIAYHVFQISNDVRTDTVDLALQSVASAHPILRTSIVTDSGLMQVVAKWSGTISVVSLPISLALGRMQLQAQPPIIGRPLSEFSIVKDEAKGQIYVVWKVHHAAYDGWTVLAIADQLRSALAGDPLPIAGPFNRFIAQLQAFDHEAGAKFWTSKLQDALTCGFPTYEGDPVSDQGIATINRYIVLPPRSSSNYTLSTVLHAAWALTLATYNMTSEVNFGTVMSGRHAVVAGIDQVMGPTVATIPLRVQLSQSDTVPELLEQVHNYITDATQFEQMGLQNIRRLSADAEKACSFETLLVVQPLGFTLQEKNLTTVQLYRARDDNKQRSRTPGTFKITLECQETQEGVDVQLHFNTSAISTFRADWVATHFARTVEQILAVASQDHTTKITDLDIIGPKDLAAMNIFQNQVDNSEVQECVHDQVFRLAETAPQKLAVDAWDGQLSYSDLARLSRISADRLLQHDLKHMEPVLLCFQKSKFFLVAALAVLAAGGTIVPVDAAQPIERLRTIVWESGATKCLCSGQTSMVAGNLGLIHLDITALLAHETNGDSILNTTDTSSLPTVDPQDLAYIIFTSGSTGTPKGVLVSHASISTSSRHHGEAYEIRPHSRVLHFASYAFDVSLAETLTTLMRGGCVCIPSDEQCKNDLAAAMERFRVSVALLTPSVASTLHPVDVPHLTTLLLGGESHTKVLRETWQRHCHVVNAYGPAECSIAVASTTPTSISDSAVASAYNDIGVLHPSVSAWVVNPRDPNRLMPFGCVGELLIGGPQLAQGYLRDEKKNAQSFLSDLAWMRHLGNARPKRVYRTGDLVRWGVNKNLILFGRQDDQVKIRGQRVELGDIEAHSQKILVGLHSIAVVPKTGPLQDLLVMLLAESGAAGSMSRPDREVFDVSKTLISESHVQDLLQEYESIALPSMKPSLWIPLRSLPLSPSGKVDRKAITRVIAQLSSDQVASIRSLRYSSDRSNGVVLVNGSTPHNGSTLPNGSIPSIGSVLEPSKGEDGILSIAQDLLAKVLQIPASTLIENSDSTFTMFGGDSIRAMVLSSQLREHGINLSASEILQAKRIATLWGQEHMKTTTTAQTPRVDSPRPTIAMAQSIQGPSELMLSSLTPGHKVEAIFNCSSIQNFMYRHSMQNPTYYRAASIIQLLPCDGNAFNEVTLAQAWSEVTKVHPLLRSVFVPTNEAVYLAVLESFAGSLDCIGQSLHTKEDAISLLKQQLRKSFPSDCPQYRVSYCTLSGSNDLLVMFDMHHALVDGASMIVILRDLEVAYRGKALNINDTFMEKLELHAPASFSKGNVARLNAQLFPRDNMNPASQHVEIDDSLFSSIIEVARLTGFTLSTIIQAAWTMTLQEITNSQCSVFGILLTHRHDTASETVGPLFDIYEQRVDISAHLDSTEGVMELLATIQEQTLCMLTDKGFGEASSASKNRANNIPSEWNTLVNMRSSISSPKTHNKNTEKAWDYEYVWAMDPMSYDVVVSGRITNDMLHLSLNYYEGIVSRNDIASAAYTIRKHLCSIVRLV